MLYLVLPVMIGLCGTINVNDYVDIYTLAQDLYSANSGRCACRSDDPNSRIDLVFLVDASGSMSTEINALCDGLEDITQCISTSLGLDRSRVRDTIFIISSESSANLGCRNSNKQSPLKLDQIDNGRTWLDPGSQYPCRTYLKSTEDWGLASAVAFHSFQWQSSGLCPKVVIPLSDEGPFDDRPGAWDTCTDCDSIATMLGCYYANINYGVILPIISVGLDEQYLQCPLYYGEQMAYCTKGRMTLTNNEAQRLTLKICQAVVDAISGFYPANIDFGGVQHICTGECLRLEANIDSLVPNAVDFTWSPSNSLDNPKARNPLACPTDDTEYHLRVIDNLGCPWEGFVRVDVGSISDYLQLPPDTSICEQTCISIPAYVPESRPRPLSLRWEPAYLLSDPLSLTPIACINQSETFILTVQDAYGCTSIDTMSAFIVDGPDLIVPERLFSCQNDSLLIKFESFGGRLPLRYQFQWQDSIFYSLLPQMTIKPEQSGEFYITVTDGNDCIDRATVYIYVEDLAPIEIIGPEYVCKANLDSLRASPIVCEGRYVWRVNGIIRREFTDAIPVFVNLTDTVTYILTAECESGCTVSDTFKVIVRDDFTAELNMLYRNACQGSACIEVNVQNALEPIIMSIDWDNNGYPDETKLFDSDSNFVCGGTFFSDQISTVRMLLSDLARCTTVVTIDVTMEDFCCNDVRYPPAVNYPACLEIDQEITQICNGTVQFFHNQIPNPMLIDTLTLLEQLTVANAFDKAYALPTQIPINSAETGYPSVHKVIGFNYKHEPIDDFTGQVMLSIDYSSGYSEVVDEKQLRLFKLDLTEERWTLIESSKVDIDKNKVSGPLGEFGGIYAILGHQQASKLLYYFSFYPNPISPSKVGHFSYLLTDNATIELDIFTINGGLVKSFIIKAGDPNGGAGDPVGKWNQVPWDATNELGRFVGNGAYIARIKATAIKSGKYGTADFLIGVAR